jgi:hypothetical protein
MPDDVAFKDPIVGDQAASELAHLAGDTLGHLLDWLSFFDDKFYSMPYSMLVLKLFSEPGMKKSELALFLEINAKISRSTAERMMREAEQSGLIVVDNPDGVNGRQLALSRPAQDHCIAFLKRRFAVGERA